MMRIVRSPLTPDEVNGFTDEIFGDMIKVVVDVKHGWLIAGAVQHAHGERELLEQGSQLEDLWGACVFPTRRDDAAIEYTSMINQDRAPNKGFKAIQDPAIQAQVKAVIARYFPTLRL